MYRLKVGSIQLWAGPFNLPHSYAMNPLLHFPSLNTVMIDFIFILVLIYNFCIVSHCDAKAFFLWKLCDLWILYFTILIKYRKTKSLFALTLYVQEQET